MDQIQLHPVLRGPDTHGRNAEKRPALSVNRVKEDTEGHIRHPTRTDAPINNMRHRPRYRTYSFRVFDKTASSPMVRCIVSV